VRLACTIGLVAYLVLLTAAVAWKPAGTWYDYLVGARIVPK
jgi:hypothetical protein